MADELGPLLTSLWTYSEGRLTAPLPIRFYQAFPEQSMMMRSWDIEHLLLH